MKKKIDKILKNMTFSDVSLDEKLSLKLDLGFDSLKMVEFIVELESEFNIELDESDLNFETIQTVGDVYSLINKYVKE